ncbi:hypothetical protein D3C85_503040 [compost metagenome]
MIGSIDMFASISSMPVKSIATNGRLSGTAAQPVSSEAPRCFAAEGAFFSSRMRKAVARKAMKIIAPAAKKVLRMPTSGGSTPPTSGPTRLPAMMADDIVPSAQPVRSLGVCVATSTIEPEAYPPSSPASSRRPTSCHTLAARPISAIATAMPRLARISIGLRP